MDMQKKKKCNIKIQFSPKQPLMSTLMLFCDEGSHPHHSRRGKHKYASKHLLTTSVCLRIGLCKIAEDIFKTDPQNLNSSCQLYESHVSPPFFQRSSNNVRRSHMEPVFLISNLHIGRDLGIMGCSSSTSRWNI